MYLHYYLPYYYHFIVCGYQIWYYDDDFWALAEAYDMTKSTRNSAKIPYTSIITTALSLVYAGVFFSYFYLKIFLGTFLLLKVFPSKIWHPTCKRYHHHRLHSQLSYLLSSDCIIKLGERNRQKASRQSFMKKLSPFSYSYGRKCLIFGKLKFLLILWYDDDEWMKDWRNCFKNTYINLAHGMPHSSSGYNIFTVYFQCLPMLTFSFGTKIYYFERTEAKLRNF